MLQFSHKFKSDADTKYIIDKAFIDIKSEKESGRIGYYFLPQDSLNILGDITQFCKNSSLLQSKKIKNIVLIGIGGSSLGIKAIDTLLAHKNTSGRKLFYFENSDPLNISTTLSSLTKEESLFIVISKSGSTIETISIFKTIIKHFNLDFNTQDKEREIGRAACRERVCLYV